MSPSARVAIVRALRGVGDMLCALPAITALRQAHPAARFTLIGLPNAEWLLERFGTLVDALLPFPGFPGIPEKPYAPTTLARFLTRVQSPPFDLAVQLHGAGTVTNAFTSLLGARTAAGLYRPGGFRPAGAFFRYPERGSEVERWLYLTDALGCPEQSGRLEFPVTEQDSRELRAHELLGGLEPGSYVCIHPGAHVADRRWPAVRFARVADELASRGYEIVLTGTACERETAEAVAAAMRAPATNAAGSTSLGVAAALLKHTALLVTNDTGISHVAAAVGAPSVVVFLASDPDRWAPLERRLHRPIVARSLASPKLDGVRCSREELPDPAEVLVEATELLGRGAAYA